MPTANVKWKKLWQLRKAVTYERNNSFCIIRTSVTVIYEDENELNHYLYFEQDDFITTMHNWLLGRLTDDEISELMCEVEYETERED